MEASFREIGRSIARSDPGMYSAGHIGDPYMK